MHIRLSDRQLVHDLVRFYREIPGCLAFQTGPDSLEALLPEALDDREEEARLRRYFDIWAVEHPGIEASFS